MKSVKPVTRNCSASGSLSDTTTSFDATIARASSVPPEDLDEGRADVAAFSEAQDHDGVSGRGCHRGQRGFEDRSGGEEQAAVGLEHDDLVGRELRGRIGLDDVPVLGEDPLLVEQVVTTREHAVQQHDRLVTAAGLLDPRAMPRDVDASAHRAERADAAGRELERVRPTMYGMSALRNAMSGPGIAPANASSNASSAALAIPSAYSSAKSMLP